MARKKPQTDIDQKLGQVAALLNTDPLSVLGLLERGEFPPPEHRLINIRQISVWIGISERTIYDWIQNKKFPEPLVLGDPKHPQTPRRWYFNEVHDWLHGRPRGTCKTNPRKKQ